MKKSRGITLLRDRRCLWCSTHSCYRPTLFHIYFSVLFKLSETIKSSTPSQWCGPCLILLLDNGRADASDTLPQCRGRTWPRVMESGFYGSGFLGHSLLLLLFEVKSLERSKRFFYCSFKFQHSFMSNCSSKHNPC